MSNQHVCGPFHDLTGRLKRQVATGDEVMATCLLHQALASAYTHTYRRNTTSASCRMPGPPFGVCKLEWDAETPHNLHILLHTQFLCGCTQVCSSSSVLPVTTLAGNDGQRTCSYNKNISSTLAFSIQWECWSQQTGQGCCVNIPSGKRGMATIKCSVDTKSDKNRHILHRMASGYHTLALIKCGCEGNGF